ncbi:YsnF/AvaK domain-containing protein [uncultured Sphingomonas sp.]|uniref:YsnF/AvaK domain-containing protein n=1 Tax=uncultured Sphingomonas sp. TaxID=158754 RepID=UPI0035CB3EFC
MNEQDTQVIPLVQEELVVSKQTVETGRVRVRTEVQWHTGHARADLFRDHVEVERVSVGREVDSVPPVREDGDTMIIPVVEEVLVVEKRLMLKEEVHLKRIRSVEHLDEAVRLRVMQAVVDREPSNPTTPKESSI